jgi:hypothetical protein
LRPSGSICNMKQHFIELFSFSHFFDRRRSVGHEFPEAL